MSEASVEARPSVTIGMDLRLFGVSPGEVLTLELRYALTEIIYLTNDDAITVTYATKRRHLVQVRRSALRAQRHVSYAVGSELAYDVALTASFVDSNLHK